MIDIHVNLFSDHYEALSRLVEAMSRAGRLEDVPRFLEMAEHSSAKAVMDPGYSYCKGLFEW